MSHDPSLSFPAIFEKTKELEAFYRFINNERTDVEEMKQSIFNETLSKLTGIKEAIVIHDTTHVSPSSKDKIVEFQKKRGFFAHLSLLVSNERTKQIYGAAGLHIWTRSEKQKIYASEADRWIEQAKKVEESVGDLDLIHLMDREGDMCLVWSEFIERVSRFVIRSKFDRKTKGKDPNLRLHEEMSRCEVLEQLQVMLPKKKASPMPGNNKAHPPREKRVATLNISAKQVQLHKTNRHGHTTEETVLVNVVRVFEKNEPTGEEAIEWLLLTTERIKTRSDILRVVELYRCRWVIEEFFKGIKTGCQLEARLLDEATSWYKLFILYLPMARNILNLRLCESELLNSPLIIESITPVQREILAVKAKEHNREIKTYKDAQLLIAKMGGYIPTKSPPGWITLLRGYKKLLLLEQGWLLARTAICDKE
jgi:hypothetical protein